jgi:FAD/FMN-containing dehydrogenase
MKDYIEHHKMNEFELKKNFDFLDKSEFSFDQEIIKSHCIDWRGKYEGTSKLIIFPKSAENISKIIKICEKKKIPLVPQGGNTSLVGGSVPRKNKNEIILNLKKLNKIRKINLIDNSITFDSGCILGDIKNKLNNLDMEFPLSMGSRGSCQIGGNISTNAGGINFIKYGSLRENIIGLEIVGTGGKIVSNLDSIKKNNTGIDLKQIFIGSEGTLGIITGATCKIFKKVSEKCVLWMGVNKFKNILNLYTNFVRSFCDQITSFEMMNNKSVSIVDNINLNIELNKKYFCLIELSNFQEIENFNEYIISKLSKMDSNLENLIIAKNDTENSLLWNIRESIPIAEKKHGVIVKHDISIPLENMDNFIENTEKKLFSFKSLEIINFGHIGDNNLHFNVCLNSNLSVKEKTKIAKKINQIIFSNVEKFGGSISAEHGIGQLRKKELKRFKTGYEYKQMKSIKKIFDPHNIFNPGKVF